MSNSVIQTSSSSSEIVHAIFYMHMRDVEEVLDLTPGNMTFWDWTQDNPHIIPYVGDFRNAQVPSRCYTCVVFDPPFTANGRGANHNSRYGSTRGDNLAPQNIHEVRTILAQGLLESMRISDKWVLVKTQDVIESGKLHNSSGLVMSLMREFGFHVEDYVLYDAPRLPQPDIERGSVIRHFRNRPSIFILGKRK